MGAMGFTGKASRPWALLRLEAISAGVRASHRS